MTFSICMYIVSSISLPIPFLLLGTINPTRPHENLDKHLIQTWQLDSEGPNQRTASSKKNQTISKNITTTTPKAIYVPPRTRGVSHLCLSVHGNGETSASRGQTPSEGGQETLWGYILCTGPIATCSVKPCLSPRGPGLTDTPLKMWIAFLSRGS